MTARDVTTGSHGAGPHVTGPHVTGPHVTGPRVTGLQVTGTAQRDAWRARVLPPVEQVRPGLWSVPVPIPDNPLRYTLSYAFTGDAGTQIVDPGWDSAAGRRALTDGLATAGVTLGDVTGIVVTHIHPDHHGLSGWVREQSGAWIAMHAAEAETLPARIWPDQEPGADQDWLRGHGVPEDDAALLLAMDPAHVARVLDLPEPDRFVADGERLPIAGRDVRAIWTPGHTPGHLCLHDAAAGVLLTGDHLLPRISPNISVLSTRDADPLSDYLASLDRTGSFGADEALPAHEYRFRGLGVRSAALIAHHHDRSAEILHVIDRPGQPTAWTIASQLTWSRGWAALHGMMRRMALGETVAHLDYLTTTQAVRPVDGPPLRWTRA
jgi:glyoxylase-like metal-dependent hydrolase (beta-lactamase superfamily II)